MALDQSRLQKFTLENQENIKLVIAEFERQAEAFKKYSSSDHDTIGLVLKYHLIIEHYMTKYLIVISDKLEVEKARLSFNQKLCLIPQNDNRFKFLRSGIKRVNEIRNKFGHQLDSKLEIEELVPLLDTLKLIYPQKKYIDPVDVIKDFSAFVAVALAEVRPKIEKAINSILINFSEIIDTDT